MKQGDIIWVYQCNGMHIRLLSSEHQSVRIALSGLFRSCNKLHTCGNVLLSPLDKQITFSIFAELKIGIVGLLMLILMFRS